MFEQTSRYSSCEDTQLVIEEGHVLTYKRRRFLPQGEKIQPIREFVISAGDRLDVIAAHTIGDPEQYWRICDANNVMHPLELTGEPGRKIKIAAPW